ncbi:EF-P 5-aminopentanol modification-associated protein YfmF [Alkalihalobacillus trypoxylicola]|uniref:Zinc protease n=1 Tax=Alkalihalobacillus trypoxylicola TaxID=519424 RepID=A0A162F7X2_9BACI|nr:pitrilysin family protein [Alkalihalobacillus trypoxylicola]KYG34999.1 zinc protease [Alkalihalobacillus trypoxylicola]
MTQLKELTYKLNNLDVHLIQTEKFKTNSIQLMIKAPLEEATVAKRALIPQILQSATQKTPNRAEFRERLDELYGAILATDIQKKGENHIISIRVDLANEKFLSDPTPLLEKGIKLLKEVLFEPLLENGHFQTDIFESEKRSLIQRIESVYDDKMRYANVRVTEEMFKGEPYALTAFGTKEQVQDLTPEVVTDYYEEMLNNNSFDLYLVGDFDIEEVKTLLSQEIKARDVIKADETKQQQHTKHITEPEVVFEEQDIKQGKLHIGFRTNTTFKDDDYVAMQVVNGLFGGFSHSKLFINVREKESLAYYAASRFESHKGLIMVMSGIEFSKYDRAVEIIKEQMKAMKEGQFSEAEMEQTKAMLINQLLESIDVARGFVELSYHQVVSNYERSVESWIEEIKSVTKEEMIQVAQKIELDTIYFLKGKEA